MTNVARPLPVPDELTKPFWDAAREGKLAIQRCKACATYYQPPVRECYTCAAVGRLSDLTFEEVSGKGTIYTYTLVHDSRIKAFQEILPYPLIQIELVEQRGLILYGNMPETPVEEIRIGAPAEVFFFDIEGGFKLPDFRLARA